ncbi:MAG: hypothetical protein QOH08_2579 [Chloroflexota bacterium]|jgi:CRP-like cAMP-binding protein|nr:hypothetical protein [Chloroflexota bacterium]
MAASGNALLDRLPGDDRARLAPLLTRMSLGHETLVEPTARIRYAYFPVRGLISIMAPLEDGRSILVATVGSEGMAGLTLLFGSSTARHGIVSEIAGESLLLAASAFAEEVGRGGALRTELERYSLVLMAQIAQTAACNAAHVMRQRLAHLLLLCHDGAQVDTFGMTQEFLAGMLGVQRPGISHTADTLRAEGLIAYRRGTIQVLDRRALESASCECYAVGQAEYGRILG